MAKSQIWSGSAWIDLYTLPSATSSVLGGVKIGSNITVSSGVISLTKANVTSALGYTPLQTHQDISGKLDKAGGTVTGTITMTAGDFIARYVAVKDASHETATDYGKILTLSSNGYIRYRTPAEIRSDIGADTGACVVTDLGSIFVDDGDKYGDDFTLLNNVRTPGLYVFTGQYDTYFMIVEDDSSDTYQHIYNDANVVRQRYYYGIEWEEKIYQLLSKQQGSSNTSNKIFLIGTRTQYASDIYTHDTVYIGTDGHLYDSGNKVATVADLSSGGSSNGGNYLPINGSEPMQGNLDMNQYNVNNVNKIGFDSTIYMTGSGANFQVYSGNVYFEGSKVNIYEGGLKINYGEAPVLSTDAGSTWKEIVTTDITNALEERIESLEGGGSSGGGSSSGSYLPLDGSKSMQGNLNLNSYNIKGVYQLNFDYDIDISSSHSSIYAEGISKLELIHGKLIINESYPPTISTSYSSTPRKIYVGGIAYTHSDYLDYYDVDDGVYEVDMSWIVSDTTIGRNYDIIMDEPSDATQLEFMLPSILGVNYNIRFKNTNCKTVSFYGGKTISVVSLESHDRTDLNMLENYASDSFNWSNNVSFYYNGTFSGYVFNIQVDEFGNVIIKRFYDNEI